MKTRVSLMAVLLAPTHAPVPRQAGARALVSVLALVMTLALTALSSNAYARESGPGNATDYVKVLFAEAQYEVLRSLGPVAESELANLGLEPSHLAFLQSKVDGVSRFELIKSYVRKMELTYQQEPCTDASKLPGTICFYRTSLNEPYVVISIQENKMTTREQAAAMLIHEAGHFTGEMNHIFLDQVGIALMDALKLPRLLMTDAESTEIVPNVFYAKDACEQGTSTQAEVLKKTALADLKIQCAARRISCDTSKAEFVFKGTQEFKPGIGFTMRVTCQVKALLGLR